MTCFLFSVVCLGIAFMVAATNAAHCPSGGSSEVTPACEVEAEGVQNIALVIAIAGLTLMIGGVAFQIGRFDGRAPLPQHPAPYPQGGLPASPHQPQAPHQPQVPRPPQP
ncbi:hypothetical protein ACFO4E_19090 [Nocardiopsis mangrovi]|uniref:Uncharacterized protein n=1 Tax=Nocardiopsis mangrovi TaxID=1179818 RepID=A0ABV9DZ50_9ACTN